MATLHICEAKQLSPKQQDVTYCDPSDPNTRYTVRCGMSGIAVQAAIRAHVAQRKAAGLDYPGRSQGAPSPVSVTV